MPFPVNTAQKNGEIRQYYTVFIICINTKNSIPKLQSTTKITIFGRIIPKQYRRCGGLNFYS